MTDKRTVRHAAKIDETVLAAHPELAVLTLDLPDSDGEPMENERERLQRSPSRPVRAGPFAVQTYSWC